jgi:ABC-type nitrate/sulfonate/bicarbonate transport system permease component
MIVIIVGVPIGMLLGLSRFAYRATQPTLEFIRTVPSIAGLPLLILLLGISFRLAVVMVIAGAVWPVVIQAMYGVRDVDPVAKQVGRAYGLSRPQVVVRIVLPSSLPYVATGIRLASLIALLLSVSASLLAGGQGIGYLIVQAMDADQPALMYARILLLGIVGLLISLAVSAMEKRLLFWHASHQRESI